MALIQCWECHKEISETAKTCPSCGAKRKSFWEAAVLGAVIFILIAIFLMFDIQRGGIFLDSIFDSKKNLLTQMTQMQDDIHAIRTAIAPTAQQHQVQQKQSTQQQAKSEKLMNDYFACEKTMQTKRDQYIKNQCSNLNSNPLEYMDCASKASATAYKKYVCNQPW